MTDRIKNISRLIFFVVLFIIFNGLCIYYEKYTANNLSSVSARYDKASISPKQIEKALLNQSSASQSGITDITLWNRLKKETIQSTVTKLKQETHVIEVYGDMSKVLPMTFLCGNYVYGKDITGCVLDMETAYQLFGSTDIINNIVLWKGKKYYVRGVVKAKDTIMLIQISDDNYLFSNVEAVCSEKVKHRIADNEGCQLKNMLTDHGAPEPDAVIDGVLTLWIIHIICHLPLWMIVITAIILMFKDTFRLRPSKALFLLSAAGTMLITLNHTIFITGWGLSYLLLSYVFSC